jgi:RHS repeat-associated protein
LVTEVEDQLQRSIFQYQDQLLGQLARYNGAVDAALLATDQQRSVLNALGARRQSSSFAYAPYGHRLLEGSLPGLPGFNGEKPEPVTGHYLLGNGYRAFNPVLMRFNSPDSLSPFGEGGVNAYAYCLGDPVNREDRTGHIPQFLKPMLRSLHLIKKSKAPPVLKLMYSTFQDGEPYEVLEQAGSSAAKFFPTPLPGRSSVRDVPNPQVRLKKVAYKEARSSGAILSQTITVANEDGEFVANIPITRRQSILIKLSRSTFDSDPDAISQSSEFISQMVRRRSSPSGWAFQRLEDL